MQRWKYGSDSQKRATYSAVVAQSEICRSLQFSLLRRAKTCVKLCTLKQKEDNDVTMQCRS